MFLQLVVIFILGLAGLSPAVFGSQETDRPSGAMFTYPQHRVVIDAGHGGVEFGTTPNGAPPEKMLNLRLARRLIELLDPRFGVVMTREGDDLRALEARTGIANGSGADLFVSLHTHRSPPPAGGRATLFYHDTSLLQRAPIEATQLPEREDAPPWERVQRRHQIASVAFAKLLERRLCAGAQTTLCRTVGAPVAVLTGLDMPGLLVEVTFEGGVAEDRPLPPADEIDRVAAALAAAVGDFFR